MKVGIKSGVYPFRKTGKLFDSSDCKLSNWSARGRGGQGKQRKCEDKKKWRVTIHTNSFSSTLFHRDQVQTFSRSHSFLHQLYNWVHIDFRRCSSFQKKRDYSAACGRRRTSRNPVKEINCVLYFKFNRNSTTWYALKKPLQPKEWNLALMRCGERLCNYFSCMLSST